MSDAGQTVFDVMITIMIHVPSNIQKIVRKKNMCDLVRKKTNCCQYTTMYDLNDNKRGLSWAPVSVVHLHMRVVLAEHGGSASRRHVDGRWR